MSRLKKSYEIVSFKTLPDQNGQKGMFEAIVSVFNNVDHMGDRVMPGAFAKTIEEWKASGDPIPVIWSHNWGDPFAHIGKVLAEDLEEVPAKGGLPGGLKVLGQLDIEKPFAAQVYDLMAERRVKEFSFAYDVVEEVQDPKDKANNLLALNIIEVGPTLKGANPDTVSLGVKAQLEEAHNRQTSAEIIAAAMRIDPDMAKSLESPEKLLHEVKDLEKLAELTAAAETLIEQIRTEVEGMSAPDGGDAPDPEKSDPEPETDEEALKAAEEAAKKSVPAPEPEQKEWTAIDTKSDEEREEEQRKHDETVARLATLELTLLQSDKVAPRPEQPKSAPRDPEELQKLIDAAERKYVRPESEEDLTELPPSKALGDEIPVPHYESGESAVDSWVKSEYGENAVYEVAMTFDDSILIGIDIAGEKQYFDVSFETDDEGFVIGSVAKATVKSTEPDPEPEPEPDPEPKKRTAKQVVRDPETGRVQYILDIEVEDVDGADE